MNNPLKGFSKIFSFTFRQHVKSRGYKNSTIVIALLCLLLPALVMTGVQKLSDADAKQMALDMDKNSYKAEKQTVSRYFDMQELKQKCEVETTYIDNGGATFVTAHAFDAE